MVEMERYHSSLKLLISFLNFPKNWTLKKEKTLHSTIVYCMCGCKGVGG